MKRKFYDIIKTLNIIYDHQWYPRYKSAKKDSCNENHNHSRDLDRVLRNRVNYGSLRSADDAGAAKRLFGIVNYPSSTTRTQISRSDVCGPSTAHENWTIKYGARFANSEPIPGLSSAHVYAWELL